MESGSPNSKQCRVDLCSRDSLARGLCSMHYRRFMYHGSTDKIGKATGGKRVAGIGLRAKGANGIECPVCGKAKLSRNKTCGQRLCIGELSKSIRLSRNDGIYGSGSTHNFHNSQPASSPTARRGKLNEIVERLKAKRRSL